MIETTSIDIIPSNFVFTFMCRFPFPHNVMAEIKYVQARLNPIRLRSCP